DKHGASGSPPSPALPRKRGRGCSHRASGFSSPSLDHACRSCRNDRRLGELEMQTRANGPVRTVFIGWGAIGWRVGDLLAKRASPAEIVGVATLDTPEARAAIPPHIPFIASPDRLAELKPDLVVEAAGRRAIDQWAPAALQHAKAMIIASTSAFVDDALL